MLRFRILWGLLGTLLVYPAVADANAVVDVYNLYRRQLAKNEILSDQLDVLKDGSSVLFKYTDEPDDRNISDYVGLEYTPDGGKVKKELKSSSSSYKCSSNEGVDGSSVEYGTGEKCRDWAVNGNEVGWNNTSDKLKIKTSAEHLRDIGRILGDTKPLNKSSVYFKENTDDNDYEHASVAVEYMNCLSGNADECKELKDWTTEILLLKVLNDEHVFEYMFGPERQYFVVNGETGQKKMESRPEKAVEEIQDEAGLKKIDRIIRTDMTDNVCIQPDSDGKVTDYSSSAKRLALAYGYAHAATSRRTAERFSKYAVSYLHDLLALDDDGKPKNFNPRTIRQDIHLLLAADAGIIYVLGQINGLQGMATELKVLDGNMGSIKTFNGITHMLGGDGGGDGSASQSEALCNCKGDKCK